MAAGVDAFADSEAPRLSGFVQSAEIFEKHGLVGVNPARQVNVRVRVIKATAPIGEVSGEAAVRRVVEPAIGDLAAKLEKVDFQQFRLVTAVNEQLAMKKRATLALSDGQSLVVRPLYVEDHRTGLWLKWLDRGGAQILDTRMHFECGESLLAGTDHQAGSGLILAIDVNPAR